MSTPPSRLSDSRVDTLTDAVAIFDRFAAFSMNPVEFMDNLNVPDNVRAAFFITVHNSVRLLRRVRSTNGDVLHVGPSRKFHNRGWDSDSLFLSFYEGRSLPFTFDSKLSQRRKTGLKRRGVKSTPASKAAQAEVDRNAEELLKFTDLAASAGASARAADALGHPELDGPGSKVHITEGYTVLRHRRAQFRAPTGVSVQPGSSAEKDLHELLKQLGRPGNDAGDVGEDSDQHVIQEEHHVESPAVHEEEQAEEAAPADFSQSVSQGFICDKFKNLYADGANACGPSL